MENNRRDDFEPIEPLDISRRPTDKSNPEMPKENKSENIGTDLQKNENPEKITPNKIRPEQNEDEKAQTEPLKKPEQKKPEKPELTEEEKKERRKKRLSLSAKIAQSTIWYPLRITLFVLVKALTYALNICFTLMIVLMITGAAVGCAFMLYIKDNIDPEYDGLDNLRFDTGANTVISVIDPTTGKELEDRRVELHGNENRSWAQYEEIPDNLIKAFVAIEDKRFFEHKGVDLKRTAGAILTFMTGDSSYGGSTITQQLIKCTSGDDDRTIQRKVQEIFRAWNVETKFSKYEILEMYLNFIYLSQNCYGVKSAAKAYFNKELNELNLTECAALASLPKSPTQYDPIRNPERNLKRRNAVLDEMLAQGKISREEYDESYDKPLELYYGDEENPDEGGQIFDYYTDALIDNVTQFLMEKYSLTKKAASRMLYSGGLKITSCCNPLVQDAMEAVFEDENCFPEAGGIPPQAAMTVIDPATGKVLGVVGGRGKKTTARGLNRAVHSTRQCGSSIKPLSIYSLAIERGLINYGTAVDDVPVFYYEDKNSFWPPNQPQRYYGMTSVSFALQKSLNTTAVRLGLELGEQECFNFLTQKLGFTTLVDRMEKNGMVYTDIAISPLALGSFTRGVNVLEVTQGYTMFANHGEVSKARFFSSIKNAEFEVIADFTGAPERTRAVSEQTAYIMTSLLRNVVEKPAGTARSVFRTYRKYNEKVQTAGKTGSTNDDRDRYFAGFTPDFAAAVWFGYDNNKSLGKFSYNPATRLWVEVFNRIYEKYDQNGISYQTEFERPTSIVEAEYCMISGKKPTEECRHDVGTMIDGQSVIEKGVFTVWDQPTEECDRHIHVFYDKKNKRVVPDGTVGPDIIECAIRDVPRREYFGRYFTVDQDYVNRETQLPPDDGTENPEE